MVSSRTYVSTLERGRKSPTLHKVDALAQVLGIHPLTLLTLAYVDGHTFDQVKDRVERELALILTQELGGADLYG